MATISHYTVKTKCIALGSYAPSCQSYSLFHADFEDYKVKYFFRYKNNANKSVAIIK